MNELKDYQQILSDKASRAETFFAKYPDADALAKNFAEVNAEKIRKVEPEIMVYGIYNAGKSSILNELIGADKAKVQDIPTTDAVDYYDWNGYKIADTPGIAAPIEHENVTQAHLKKADIVLFVMSTTGSNELAENYRRMKDIADAGKKIIIVLNDMNGDLGQNDEAIRIIKTKVAANMLQCGIDNVDEKFCIVTVNALRARTGRVKNKPGLIAKSGLDELKSVILSELKRTTSFVLLRNGITQLEEILTEFVNQLESRENSALLREMNRVLETFNKQKISMRRAGGHFRRDVAAENLGQPRQSRPHQRSFRRGNRTFQLTRSTGNSTSNSRRGDDFGTGLEIVHRSKTRRLDRRHRKFPKNFVAAQRSQRLVESSTRRTKRRIES